MGSAIGGLPETPALSTEARPDAIGPYLARQRKLRGISLDQLESLTRIPRRSLERLEAGAFDRDPDGFARGFVRTVAAAIGLDPDETVARMLAEPCEEGRSGPLPLPRVVGVLGLVAVAAAAAWLALGAPGPRPEPRVAVSEAPAPRVRRDAVKALAASGGARPERPPAPEAAAPGPGVGYESWMGPPPPPVGEAR